MLAAALDSTAPPALPAAAAAVKPGCCCCCAGCAGCSGSRAGTAAGKRTSSCCMEACTTRPEPARRVNPTLPAAGGRQAARWAGRWGHLGRQGPRPQTCWLACTPPAPGFQQRQLIQSPLACAVGQGVGQGWHDAHAVQYGAGAGCHRHLSTACITSWVYHNHIVSLQPAADHSAANSVAEGHNWRSATIARQTGRKAGGQAGKRADKQPRLQPTSKFSATRSTAPMLPGVFGDTSTTLTPVSSSGSSSAVAGGACGRRSSPSPAATAAGAAGLRAPTFRAACCERRDLL